MASFDQKFRTLRLMEILLERTDDEHMLNASELCTILDQEYGISTDRRTIYTEMEILDKFGLDIQQKKGKCPGYYIGARDFELPELKLLVDAFLYAVKYFCPSASSSCRLLISSFLANSASPFADNFFA